MVHEEVLVVLWVVFGVIKIISRGLLVVVLWKVLVAFVEVQRLLQLLQLVCKEVVVGSEEVLGVLFRCFL